MGAQIQDYILKNISQMGNGKCNYRHLYPIYYEDVYNRMDICPIRMDIDNFVLLKLRIMKLNRLLILLGLLNLLIVSEDPNNWGYDPNYDNMYRPIHFDIVEERPTSVIVSFTGVIDATNIYLNLVRETAFFLIILYVLETALVDTLTAYKEGNTVTATEYRLLFEDHPWY